MADSKVLLKEVRARRSLPPPAMRRAIRQGAGLSLARFAEALDVSEQAVSYWERGERKPRAANLIAYSALLRSLQATSA